MEGGWRDWREDLLSSRVPDPPPPLPRQKHREVLHPISDAEEFRAAAIAWGRQEREYEDSYNNNGGTVIAFGFERKWNEAQPRLRQQERDDLAAWSAREIARIDWCDDLGGGAWSDDAPLSWMDQERIAWCEDDLPECWTGPETWGWCNEDYHAGWTDEPQGFWSGEEAWGWCDDDVTLWCGDDVTAWCLEDGGRWLDWREREYWCEED